MGVLVLNRNPGSILVNKIILLWRHNLNKCALKTNYVCNKSYVNFENVKRVLFCYFFQKRIILFTLKLRRGEEKVLQEYAKLRAVKAYLQTMRIPR